MDATDFRILAHLVREPLASVAELTRPAGLTRNAVRTRLDRLTEEGVLLGVQALPHPALFGTEARVRLYQPARHPGRDAILACAGVTGYSVNHEGWFAVTRYQATDADAGAAAPPDPLDAAMGGPPGRTFAEHAAPLARADLVLSPLQWRVLRALVQDARATVQTQAAEAGIAPRTFTRHRDALLAKGQVTLQTAVMADLAAGVVLYHVFVQGEAARTPARLTEVLKEAVVEVRLVDPPGVMLFARAAKPGEALSAPRRLRQVEGVDNAELILFEEGAYAHERLVAMCREGEERWATMARDGARTAA